MIKYTTDCTACGACAQACPEQCISMQEDCYGFVYPEVDETKCISCGICNRVCHLENVVQETRNATKAYAAIHENENVARKSTSGGVFSAVAEHIFLCGGVVYGCAYTEDLKPAHIRITKEGELDSVRGSKYVQSDIGRTYVDALEDLNAGRMVFFTGTPCQIAGLKAFLRKPYENLITADLVCHGVPSYAYFRKFLDWYEQKYSCKVLDYNFRSKENGGWSLAGKARIEKNGSVKQKNIYYFHHYYYDYFLKGEIYRDSCYRCKYANAQRVGDITLGDFWGAETIKLGFRTENGCSLLLVHTPTGERILKECNIRLQEIPMEVAVRYNVQLRAPSEHTAIRESLMEEYRSCSAEEIQNNYKKRFWKKRIVSRIKRLVPGCVKTAILRKKKRA